MNTLKKTITLSPVAIAMTFAMALPVTLLEGQPGLAQGREPAKQEEIVPANTSFRPPRNPRRRSGYRTTTGTRLPYCIGENDAQSAFVTLGPSETVDLTTSARPEFTWYLPHSNVSYPVQFRLLAPNAAGIPSSIYEVALNYSKGFSTYQLPAEVAPLSPDTEYRWQVIVTCDANNPSRSLVQERSFEVVSPSLTLQQKLETATTAAEQSLAYAEEGYWYDAIAQVASANDSASRAVRQSLLEDLAQIESADASLYEDISRIAELSLEL
jgi:hypothetical protein